MGHISSPDNHDNQSPPKTRNLSVLIVSTFLIGATWTISRSLLQPLILYLGGSIAIVGIMVSLSNISRLIPMLIFGEYSDKVGRKRPLLLSGLLLLVAGFLFVIAPHWWWLIPAVIVTGLAFALNQPASNAALAESVPAYSRGSAFAYRNSGRLLAGMIASILGIIVVKRNIQSAFLLGMIFSIINLGVLYFLLIETHPSPLRGASTRLFRSIRNNLRVPPKLRGLYIYVIFADTFSYGIGWQLIYGLLANFQNVSSETLLVYTLLSNLAGGGFQIFIAGRVVDRTRKWAIVLSDAIAVPSILICALFPSKIIFPLVFILFGIAMSFWGPAVQSLVVDHVDKGRVAAEFGKLWGLKGIVGIFPPIIGGLLATKYGYSAPLVANFIFGILSLTVAIFLIERRHKT